MMHRFLPLIIVILGTSVLLGLGTWQMQRLGWKERLIKERQAGLAMPSIDLPDGVDDWRGFAFRTVRVNGVFRHDLEQIFGVEARGGVLGHHVLTPLARAEGPMILVNRGWIPAERIDPATRLAGQLTDPTTLEGVARYRLDDQPGWFTPENDPAAGLWYHYDLAAMETALGIPLAPLVIEADDMPNPGGLPIGGSSQIKLANNHLQYALTWYALAVGLIGVYIVFHRQNAKARADGGSI